MQIGDLGAGVHAQLLTKPARQVREETQGLGPTSVLVQGTHPCGDQALTQGVLRQRFAQVPRDLPVFTQVEADQGVLLGDGEPFLFKARPSRFGERLIHEVGQRRTAPQLQGPGEQSGA